MKNKYFKSESVVLKRSQIKPSGYNPRQLSEEAKKQLKRSLKRYGVVGGIVVNRKTGFTIVGGHQKVMILDEIHKYNPITKENDYELRVELIDVDLQTEKELNITLNNPNVSGDWNYDKLREMLPDIDYKNAGLTDEDLSLIGIDFEFQTETESDLADALADLSAPIVEQREIEKEAKKEAVKAMKSQIQEKAEAKAQNLETYVMLNFESLDAKNDFLERFGYTPLDKFIQGEYLVKLIDEME